MTDEEKKTPESETGDEPRTPFDEFLFHQRRALEETGKALEALLPEGFRTHSHEASKEFSKGLRVLVDAAVEELKKAGEKSAKKSTGDDGPATTTGKTKVKVEVE
jgi:hypothetical protein